MSRKLPMLTERSVAQMKAERARLDAEFDNTLPVVACKEGCSSCCSYPLYISILEGMTLYRHLASRGLWSPSLRKKLEQHAERTYDLKAEIWLMLNLPCPLLENKKCLAYTARPFSCRTIYATSDPDYCHPHRISEARFVNRDAILQQFRETEGKILSHHRLSLLGMPVSRAVLIGAQIVNGEVDLERVMSIALLEP